LEGDWCLFEGAIRVSIFHSRKEKKKRKEQITKPKKRIKKNEKQKTLIYEN